MDHSMFQSRINATQSRQRRFKKLHLVRMLLFLLPQTICVKSTHALTAPCNMKSATRISRRQSSLEATPSPTSDPAARFHSDMHRVLTSRRNLMSNSSVKLSPLERRRRPEVLSMDIDGAERVVSMLTHMIAIGVATEETFQITLQALVNRGRLRWRQDNSVIVCAADEVSRIMHGLWGYLDKDQISTETCNLALQAYAVCATPRGNRQYAQSAQNLVDKMDEFNIPVTAETLMYVVHAWSWQQGNMQSGHCANMAQASFDRLHSQSPDVETLQQSYHLLLEAWSKSSNEGSREKTERIFEKMISLRKKYPGCTFPDASSYSNVILGWSKARDIESIFKAQHFLEMSVTAFEKGEFPRDSELEIISFNAVLGAWSRLGRPLEAEELLWTMEELGKKYTSLLPDMLSYNSVMTSHLKAKNRKEGLNRILEILNQLEKSERPGVKPNCFSYGTLLKAWAQIRDPNGPVKAVEVLSRMRELWDSGDKSVLPSNHFYNIAINAVAKSSSVDARSAYELLLQMQASHDVQPDIITYTSVIECLSKSDDPEAANLSLELLRQATAIYEESQEDRMMPNLRTYAMVIAALGTKPVLENIIQARNLLTELLDLYIETEDKALKPNTFPYNNLLNCASNCIGTASDKAKAFKLAAQTYNEMRKNEGDTILPDSFTYAFWFKCCNNLLPEGEIRTKGVTFAFEQCKLDGLVSPETLRRLLAGSPSQIVPGLLGLSPGTPAAVYRRLTIEDLPPSWSRNVK